MKLLRRLLVIFCLVALIGAIWGAVYARKYGFSQSWRTRIEQEVAKRGYFIRIGKLTLGPLRGLVAEDVQFFQSEKRREEIAFLDDVYLDLDFRNVFNRKQLSINTLDIQKAKLSLPLEPGNTNSKSKLKIGNISGRVVVTESQIEIVRTSAEIEGIEVSIKGSLYRPAEASELFSKKNQSKSEREQELQEIADRRALVRKVLSELKRFEFLTSEKPRLELEFRSELENLTELRAQGRFVARDFRRGRYTVESIDITAEYDGERDRAILKDLKLRDEKGDLRINAEWQEDSKDLRFSLHSTADLPQLAASILTRHKLGEVVFFSPPKVEMEGKINLEEIGREDVPEFWIPADVVGHFRCDRFVAKGGEVFSGMEFDFSASGDRFYLRNCRLDHKTGIVQANLMFDGSGGERSFRFQSEIKMDPGTFSPFFSDENTRSFLDLWDFDSDSTVYVAAVGQGPSLDSNTWQSKGVVDLRNFKLGGEPFGELEASYELDGYTQTFRDVRLLTPTGLFKSDEIVYNAKTKKWKLPEIFPGLNLLESPDILNPTEREPESGEQ